MGTLSKIPVGNFNPRAPYGARPSTPRSWSGPWNFNPRAPYGARQHPPDGPVQLHRISILAPLTGRDSTALGGRMASRRFQSSRPLRGATPSRTGPSTWSFYFNPRAPYGARLHHPLVLLGGEDFNPRAPYGARRAARQEVEAAVKISILAPLTGRDVLANLRLDRPILFQSSRPLRGATADCGGLRPESNPFQSSRPLRGATAKIHKNRVCFCNNRQRTNAFPPSSAACQDAF